MTSAAAAPQPAGPGPAPTASMAGSAAATSGLISIGEVLAQLREDFPDVTISKLRFLEAEGLVEPQRTPAGYRKYNQADVRRLRYVLEAQRDRFLPLRVIRDQLAAIDRGETPTGLVGGARPTGSSPEPMPTSPAASPAQSPATHSPALPTAHAPPTAYPSMAVGASMSARASMSAYASPAAPGSLSTGPTVGGSTARMRFSRTEVLGRSGLTDAMLTELEATGLLGSRANGWFDGDAVVVAEVAGALATYGLAPRHLRAYRAGADREVGMFAQLLAPLQRSSMPAAQARAAEVVGELTMLSQQLHAALVRIGLRDVLGH
jgi:DNA-binding transcriptional MerR regulator